MYIYIFSAKGTRFQWYTKSSQPSAGTNAECSIMRPCVSVPISEQSLCRRELRNMAIIFFRLAHGSGRQLWVSACLRE